MKVIIPTRRVSDYTQSINGGQPAVLQGPKFPYYLTAFGRILTCWPAVDLCLRPNGTKMSQVDLCSTFDGRPKQTQNHYINKIVSDPVGFGFAAKMQAVHENDSSYRCTAYFTLKEVTLENDAIAKSVSLHAKTIFSADVTSGWSQYQKPAFSPDGRFLVNPDDGVLDILVAGNGGLPFSQVAEDAKDPGEFKTASSVTFPCRLNHCAVSPRDGWTIACGCANGHVHFVKPVM